MRFQKAPLLKPLKASVFISVFGCFGVDDMRKRISVVGTIETR